MRHVLLIDNYDSFTYNLSQYLQTLGCRVSVVRNDAITLAEALHMDPDYIVISPGPGTPEKASDVGISPQLIDAVKGRIPILGVCLGHQLLGHHFGGSIRQVPPMHGKRSIIHTTSESILFKGLSENIEVMRYHSLVVDAKSVPELFTVTATTADGLVMAMENKAEQLYGVQFHPESIGTKTGLTMLENFLRSTAYFCIEQAETKPQIVQEILGKIHGRGETAQDISDFVHVLSEKSITAPDQNRPVFDVCGTGGSGINRINISTPLAIALSTQFTIAKHGNKGASGRVGSFDVLEYLQMPIATNPDEIMHHLQEKNVAFVYAPAFHPALKPMAPIRKNLGHPTIFNYVGPLLNPVPLTAQVIGVSSPKAGALIATAAQKLGKEVLIVHDIETGLDEVSIMGTTQFWKVQQGTITTGSFTPEAYDIEPITSLELIAGTGTIKGNAEIVTRLIHGTAPEAHMKYMQLSKAVAEQFFSQYTT